MSGEFERRTSKEEGDNRNKTTKTRGEEKEVRCHTWAENRDCGPKQTKGRM